jgi:hypothetical protein
MGEEWKRRGRKLLGGRKMDCNTGEGGKVKRVIRNNRTVMVKLIIQE